MVRMAPISPAGKAPGAALHRGRDTSNHRILVLKLDGGSWPVLRSTPMAGIALEQVVHQPATTMVTLRLLQSEHLGPFRTLCDDIIQEVLKASDATTARDKFIARTQSWQDLMRRAASPLLSPQEQMGLIGELVVLRDLLQPVFGAARAVGAWTGPSGTPKDFEAGAVWIEAKAFGAAGRRQVHITSETQLDDSGSEALYLHVTALTSNVPNSSGGCTLPEWILDTRESLALDDASCLADYDRAIDASGFDPHHQYDATWSAGSVSTYRIDGDFPRIVPSAYPSGPVNVSYDLPLSAIEDWRVSPKEIQDRLVNCASSGGQLS